jgi:hypothetical protein
MATKHAPNMGSSMVTLMVISVTNTMPVSGARTTPVKKAASGVGRSEEDCVVEECLRYHPTSVRRRNNRNSVLATSASGVKRRRRSAANKLALERPTPWLGM